MSNIEDVYRDWEERYSQMTASQAEFFAPADINLDQCETRRSYHLSDDEDIPVDPSVPLIIVIGPEDVESPPPNKLLSRAAPLSEKKAQFREDELQPRSGVAGRRYSMNMIPGRPSGEIVFPNSGTKAKVHSESTPRPWIATDTNRTGGWRMRSRCSPLAGTEHTVDIVIVYVYNSAVCDKARDRDADLDVFRYHPDSEATRSQSVSVMKFKRAQTDLGKQSRPTLPNIFGPTSSPKKPQQWTDFTRDQTGSVNWLQDHDMLRKHMPGSRIITVGFDIFPVLSSPPNYESAARQLIEHLQDCREQVQVPIIFLGHTLGGMMIIQGLVLPPLKGFFTDEILACTAGVFLFSQFMASPESHARKMADLYDLKASDKIFSDPSENPTMERLSKSARRGLFSSHPRDRDLPKGPPRRKHSRAHIQRVAIGFPITHILAQDDNQSTGSQTLSTFLGAPVRTVSIGKTFGNSMRFPSAEDADFLRIVLLMQSALNTCRLLYATAAREIGKVDSLIRAGINPNLRDRWFVQSVPMSFPPKQLISQLLFAIFTYL